MEPHDTPSVRPTLEALRVRLVSPAFLEAAGAGIPHRTHAVDLHEALAVDTPTDVQMLELAGYASLGLSEDELFFLGRQNVRLHEQVEIQHIDDVGGVPMTVIESDSFYTTTHALELDRLIDVPPGGVLLGLPDRHVILAHRVQGSSAQDAVGPLIKLTLERFQTQEGHLSPHLYWWQDGVLERQLVEVAEGGSVRFTPGPRFVAVLG